MPRIKQHVGTYNPTLDDHDAGTAARFRDASVRGPMHDSRDGEADMRNTSRSTAADVLWRPGLSLDAPEPRPGYVQRWIRMGFNDGTGDVKNVQGKVLEGWAPRDPATVNEHDAYFRAAQVLTSGGQFRVGNLVLHEMPEQIMRQKRAYVRDLIKRQERSVATETEKASGEGTKRGFAPIVREESAEYTTGRRPNTLAD